MIYQLPSGRIIELSIEQFLSSSDSELSEMNGINNSFTSESSNPFHNLFSGSVIYIDPDDPDLPEELLEKIIIEHYSTPELPDVDPNEKLEDEYFHSDDT